MNGGEVIGLLTLAACAFGVFAAVVSLGRRWWEGRDALRRYAALFGVRARWWESEAAIRARCRRAWCRLEHTGIRALERAAREVPGVRSARAISAAPGRVRVEVTTAWWRRKAPVIAGVVKAIDRHRPIGVAFDVVAAGGSTR